MPKYNLTIEYNSKVLIIGDSIPIRKRRYIAIEEIKKNQVNVIGYLTKEGEKIFDEFMENNDGKNM